MNTISSITSDIELTKFIINNNAVDWRSVIQNAVIAGYKCNCVVQNKMYHVYKRWVDLLTKDFVNQNILRNDVASLERLNTEKGLHSFLWTLYTIYELNPNFVFSHNFAFALKEQPSITTDMSVQMLVGCFDSLHDWLHTPETTYYRVFDGNFEVFVEFWQEKNPYEKLGQEELRKKYTTFLNGDCPSHGSYYLAFFMDTDCDYPDLEHRAVDLLVQNGHLLPNSKFWHTNTNLRHYYNLCIGNY